MLNDKLKLIFKKKDDPSYMDWIDMAQNRDRYWAFVNAVIKLRVP